MKKNMLSFCACIFLLSLHVDVNAQQRQISGIIVNSDGSGVPSATIVVIETKEATTTNDQGKYSIMASTGQHLKVSSVGYLNNSVAIGKGNELSISLEASNKELSEVVVTALGIKREKKSLGYATAHLSSNDLNSSRPVNVATGMIGKVSGMNISLVNSGVNPDNIRITLRGNRSFLGNNQPLIVVDGVPVANSYLAQMDADAIATVDVLKGATASALYGSQAANGVMIITTKAAEKAKPTITLNSTVSFEQVSLIPQFQEEFGPASTEYLGSDVLSYSNPSNFQNGYVPYENQSMGSPFSAGSPFGGDSVVIGIPSADGKVQKVPYKGLPNEFRNFWNTGVTYQNAISYLAGDDKSTFLLSAQNINRTGILPGDKYNRNSFGLKASRQFGAFKATGNVSYGASHTDQGDLYDAYFNITNIAPNVPYTSYQNINAPFADINTYYNAYGINPYWYLQNQRNNTYRQDFLGSLDLSLDITRWMNIDYLIGTQNYSIDETATEAAFNFSPYAIWMANHTLGGNESIFQGNTLPTINSSSISNDNFYSNLKMTFHKKFGNISTQLILGNVVNQNKYNLLSNGSNTLLNIDNFYNVNFREGVPNVNQQMTKMRNYGNFGDLTLGYNDYLFLHASGRLDETSLLNADNRQYFYPGIDAALVLSEAISSLKNSKTISFLKIRGAVTKTGNVNVNPYQVQNVFSSAQGFPFGQLPALTTSTSATLPGLKPEFTLSKEVGAEIAFLNSRIDLQASYFQEKTTNETVPINISAATGYTQSLANIGEMTNNGLELDLNITPVITKSFRWDVGIHYTQYQNKVVSLGQVSSLYIGNNAYAVVGKSYPQLMLTDFLRDSIGQLVVDANTGLPSNATKLVDFGTSNPKYTIGINTSLSYKRFTLSIVAQYKGGNVIYNGTGYYMDVFNISKRFAVFDRSKFYFPNSVIMGSNGKYIANPNDQLFDFALWGGFPESAYMTSGAFWSLRNASISYTLPKNIVGKLKYVQNISVSAVGSNLLLIVPKSNIWTDPEFGEDTGNATGSNSIHQSPPTRTYGLNLKIVF
jgi:TonB-linked SusC/RagA family outer membrane protein